jgi:hypothetical protein
MSYNALIFLDYHPQLFNSSNIRARNNKARSHQSVIQNNKHRNIIIKMKQMLNPQRDPINGIPIWDIQPFRVIFGLILEKQISRHTRELTSNPLN